MTTDEVREHCSCFAGPLRLAGDDSLYFEVDNEISFSLQSPQDFRNIGFISHALSISDQDGGILWLQIMYGDETLVGASREIIENMRLRNGDTRSLDIAPAQQFEPQDQLQLQVMLMQAIGNGWNGYYIPAGKNFLIGLRSSHRIFCYGKGKHMLSTLLNSLQPWSPQEVTSA